jgi:hypothetical protein
MSFVAVFALLAAAPQPDPRVLALFRQAAMSEAQLDQSYCGDRALEERAVVVKARLAGLRQTWRRRTQNDPRAQTSVAPSVVSVAPVQCPTSQVEAFQKLESAVSRLEAISE